MNRFVLFSVLLLSSSCELPSIIQADQYVEPTPIEISSNVPDYKNVWDRIKDANSSNQEDLDEKK